jgi:hypothetical protein
MNRVSMGGIWMAFGMALAYLVILLYAGMKLTA